MKQNDLKKETNVIGRINRRYFEMFLGRIW